MRVVTKKFKVFKFKELSQQAKEKAINEEVRFYLEAVNYDEMTPKMKEAIDEAERMQTPWFAGEYIWDYCKDDILKVLNSYEYLENGQVFI